MSTAPLTFTGVSTFSSDFQTILTREQAIEKLPITALQNKQSDNLNKKSALVALNPLVSSLATSITNIASMSANQGLSASSSDSSTVSMVNTGATYPASYTISNISSLATAAAETSVTGYTDSTTVPVSTGGLNKVDLVVGSNTFHLDLTGANTLNGLKSAINASGAPVTASILTTSTGNYLSLSANSLGATKLQLNDVTDTISNTGTGTETGSTGYNDVDTTAVSTSGKLDFNIGSSTYHLDLTGKNNLNGLVDAINATGASVTASITTSNGKNYLQIATNDASAATMSLTNTDRNLITSANQGSNADFYLNGNIHITRSSNTVSDVIPGVAFTLKKTTAPTGSVTLGLTSDPSQLSSALQSLVTNYNAVVDQVDQQVGSSAGALAGDNTIFTISDDMRQLSSYWAGGNNSVRSLYDVGIKFDVSGHMSFDSTVVSGMSNSQLSDAFNFFGSSQLGFKSLAKGFTQVSDSTTGMIRLEEDGLDKANTSLGDQIATLQTRNAAMQAVMSAKLQQADALVAQLQSQQTSLTAAIQSINYVTYGKQTNTSQ